MDPSAPREITRMLGRIGRRDELASEALLPLVYEELRGLASRFFRQRKPGQTLQPTALVHEAFIKLTRGESLDWESRAHFFAVAAMAMRQILASHADRKRAAKRGGEMQRVTLSGQVTPARTVSEIDLIDLDDALAKLAELSPRQAKIVEMRFLAGIEEREIARVLGLSERTVRRQWRMARAFLKSELSGDDLS